MCLILMMIETSKKEKNPMQWIWKQFINHMGFQHIGNGLNPENQYSDYKQAEGGG